MTDIASIKSSIISILKNDSTLQNVLGRDREGNIPVYASYITRKTSFPCITVMDVTEQSEVSGFNDSYDGNRKYSWQYAVIQIDCWSASGPSERDNLQVAVQKCLLNNTPAGVLYCHEPIVTVLDEPDAKPPLWRKSIRYHVMYVLEV